MKAASLPATSAQPRASGLEPLLEALRGLGPRHLAAAIVVALLLSLVRGGNLAFAYSQGRSLLPGLSGCLIAAVSLVLGVVVADAYVRRGAAPLTAYAVAVGMAACAASITQWHVVGSYLGPEVPIAIRRSQMLYTSILYAVQGGFGAAVWHEWRKREAASRRIQAIELRRAEAERQVQQTRLRALQAQVEPELLFAALQRVGELAGSARNEDAERLLDELIGLLRLLKPDGTPAGNPAATTVERELATAAAYLRVHAATSGESCELALTIAADVASAPMPPMLVLPIARAIARRETAARMPLRIRADRIGQGITLSFAGGEGFVGPLLEPADLAELRRRLEEAFAIAAATAVATDAPATLTLHLPPFDEPEPTDRADR